MSKRLPVAEPPLTVGRPFRPTLHVQHRMQLNPSTQLRRHVLDAMGRLGMGWTLTLIVICVDALWLLLEARSVPLRAVIVVALTASAFVAPLALPRYRSDLRLRATLPAAALLFVFLAAGATLSYLVVSTNAPLVDPALAAWDRALGFDWMALNAWLQSHPSMRMTLRLAYGSGLVQLTFVVLFLGLSARPERLDEFMRLFIVTALVTVLVSGLLPAAGTWKHYGVASQFDVASLTHFELLRDGRMHDIPLDRMQGLISIPSMHAAMAVLIVHAMRAIRLWPVFVVLNAAMLASTPIDGSHYLVDVLAGVGLAVWMIALERRRHAHPVAAAGLVLTGNIEAAPR